MTWSKEAATWKMEGTTGHTKEPHFLFYDVETMRQQESNLPVGCMIGLWNDTTPPRIKIAGRLVEACCYDDGSYHLLFFKSDVRQFEVNFPQEQHNKENLNYEDISFSFICTADDTYLPILKETLAWYAQQIGGACENVVALYGDATLPDHINCLHLPPSEFHMSKARNVSLRATSRKYVFVLDADIRLSKAEIDELLQKFNTVPNHGVFNLKNTPTTGNGLYFGERDKLVTNGFDERFLHFFGEDTEYLMNFSRDGIIPVIVNQAFTRIDHSRSHTNNAGLINQHLLAAIVQNGRCP